MNGAEALIRSLGDSGVDTCFANPGTSEMQLVAAIDGRPEMRAILGLFEGVVTGAADGYGRMADKPAATLLHLGPGLANGCANLHNAKRARTPVVNLVGDHATYHLDLDAPLTSDIAGVARPMSDWVAVSASPGDLAGKGVAAVAEALRYPGQIATLIVPANHAWDEGGDAVRPRAPLPAPCADDDAVAAAAAALAHGGRCALFLGGRALRADALEAAGRIAARTGARILCETFPARLQRGAGRVPVERLPYFAEVAAEFLTAFDALVLVGAPAPVAFFAYPDKPSRLSPAGAEIVTLAAPREQALDALERLAAQVGAAGAPLLQPPLRPEPPVGALAPAGIGAILASMLPENAIVSDEGTTGSGPIYQALAGAPAHDWLTLTGGSIGQGLPLALGAAVACPDRKVVAVQSDGSAMYTVQALWTMARENLDVTVILLNNGSYAILQHELRRVGVASPGPTAQSLLDLTRPEIDWTAMSEAMGVRAICVTTLDAFAAELADALAQHGPRLIEARMAPAGS